MIPEATSMTNSSFLENSSPSPENGQENALVSVSAQSDQFLRLHLVQDMTALLPIQQVAEALTIPMGTIVPIPHMPPWVMGVYNWRGEVLWMVDLGHLCGLAPWYEQITSSSVYEAVVLQVADDPSTQTQSKNQTLGLVVDRVEDIEWCDWQAIQCPPNFTLNPKLKQILRGYWWKSNDVMLAVLDGSAILRAMPK
ncbi:chemotaxis protein CheW [Fischerella muscicola CCMEE 5323]|uniref:Chemotaxis protein CheW n=2 Tax=Hapalosiphonaceae TaxID=1892263 RepID=A0A2N6K5L4_FISMU|nr:chemotaxis protein CheW [Fischerella muscicola CCMEE 5323]